MINVIEVQMITGNQKEVNSEVRIKQQIPSKHMIELYQNVELKDKLLKI